MPVNWNGTIAVELGNGFWIFLAVVVGALVLWYVLLKDDGKRAASGADSYLAGLRRAGLAGRK